MLGGVVAWRAQGSGQVGTDGPRSAGGSLDWCQIEQGSLESVSLSVPVRRGERDEGEREGGRGREEREEGRKEREEGRKEEGGRRKVEEGGGS